MKVKLLKEIRVGGKAKKAGSTVEVTEAEGSMLVGTKRATEVGGKAEEVKKG